MTNRQNVFWENGRGFSPNKRVVQERIEDITVALTTWFYGFYFFILFYFILLIDLIKIEKGKRKRKWPDSKRLRKIKWQEHEQNKHGLTLQLTTRIELYISFLYSTYSS